MSRIMSILRTSASALGFLLILPSALVASGIFADRLGWIPEPWVLYGIDYVPSAWTLVPAIPGAMLLALGGLWRLGIGAASAFVLFAVTLGDTSLDSVVHPPRQHDTDLTVVALNVRYYWHGVDTVAMALQKMGADVIMLSENTFDHAWQESLLVAMMSPMSYFSGRNNGTAILSRHPILEAWEVDLPSREALLAGSNDYDQIRRSPNRTFVHAIIDVNGIPTHFLSVRLIAGRAPKNTMEDNLQWGRFLLSTQLEEVEFFRDYVLALEGPVIFGGDMNAPPQSKAMRRLTAIARDAYFVDHLWGDFTFRTEFPTLRLDYLFCMNGVAPVRSARLNDVVSDHFPIKCEFALPNVAVHDPIITEARRGRSSAVIRLALQR